MTTCKNCGQETGADWKNLCLTCWKEERGIPAKNAAGANFGTKRPKKEGAFPLWVVWHYEDPAIVGDYTSEVYREVHFIGTQEECMKEFEQVTRGHRPAGNRPTYYGYPTQIRDGEVLREGTHVTIHAAKKSLSNQERWEIAHGY